LTEWLKVTEQNWCSPNKFINKSPADNNNFLYMSEKTSVSCHPVHFKLTSIYHSTLCTNTAFQLWNSSDSKISV